MGPDRKASSLADLESMWKARWLELEATSELASPGAFRDFMSNSLVSLSDGLSRSAGESDPLTAIKLEEFKSLSRAPLERQLMLAQEMDRKGIDRLFEGAETIRVEIPRQRLQDILHNDRLPAKSIIEVRGTGEIDLPVIVFEDKIIRIDFGKPGDIVLKPLENKSSVAQRSEDKLPFESLFTVRNGFLDLRGATIVMTPTKTLNSPIWAITTEHGHLALDHSQIIGPIVTDSLHAGLIRQVWRDEAPSKKIDLSNAVTIIENSSLYSPKAIYSAEYFQPRLRFSNNAIVSMDDALLLSTTTPKGNSSQGRIELSHLTISSFGSAIAVEGDSAGDRSVPVVVQDCVFAPSLDLKTDSTVKPLFAIPSGQKSFIFWWFQNGITPAHAQLTANLRQADNTPSEWKALWRPGHDVGTLFGADGVLMNQTLPEPKEYDILDLQLSSTCKASTWSGEGGPIGADIKQLAKTFESGGPSRPGPLRETPSSGGKIIRPGF